MAFSARTGLRPCAEAYPAPELLARFQRLGVPITTASDGHRLGDVSWRISDLVELAQAVGYTEVSGFRRRPSSPRSIEMAKRSVAPRLVRRSISWETW